MLKGQNLKKRFFMTASSLAAFFVLAACSGVSFNSSEGANEKAGGEAQPEPIPVEEVVENNNQGQEVDLDLYLCDPEEYGDHDAGELEDDDLDECEGDECSMSVSGSYSKRKVLVCHVPAGNPEAQHEICISESALEAHVGCGHGHHGDYVGECIEGGYVTDDGGDDDDDGDDDPMF